MHKKQIVLVATAIVLCISMLWGGMPQGYANDVQNAAQDFSIGNYVTFGTYPQTAAGNDATPIEWLVLEQDGNKALLISRYALDCKPYNVTRIKVSWETCTLRQWQNNDFINKAFTAAEQEAIPTVMVIADGTPYNNINLGNDTWDKIFLLSIKEANEYFSYYGDGACKPTAYAAAHGASYVDDNGYAHGSYYTSSAIGNCWWWLRVSGQEADFAPFVNCWGDEGEYFVDVDNGTNAVRPALWVDLDAGIF